MTEKIKSIWSQCLKI